MPRFSVHSLAANLLRNKVCSWNGEIFQTITYGQLSLRPERSQSTLHVAVGGTSRGGGVQMRGTRARSALAVFAQLRKLRKSSEWDLARTTTTARSDASICAFPTQLSKGAESRRDHMLPLVARSHHQPARLAQLPLNESTSRAHPPAFKLNFASRKK